MGLIFFLVITNYVCKTVLNCVKRCQNFAELCTMVLKIKLFLFWTKRLLDETTFGRSVLWIKRALVKTSFKLNVFWTCSNYREPPESPTTWAKKMAPANAFATVDRAASARSGRSFPVSIRWRARL